MLHVLFAYVALLFVSCNLNERSCTQATFIFLGSYMPQKRPFYVSVNLVLDFSFVTEYYLEILSIFG